MTIFSTKAQRRIDLVLAARHVPAKLLELEPTLIRRRWPGYNFTGQLELTQEFMRAYDDRFYSAFKVEISITREIDHPEFLTVWHMRQAADWWPIPYADYLTIAFTLARTKVERFMVPHLRYLRHNTNRNLLKKLKKDAPRNGPPFSEPTGDRSSLCSITVGFPDRIASTRWPSTTPCAARIGGALSKSSSSIMPALPLQVCSAPCPGGLT